MLIGLHTCTQRVVTIAPLPNVEVPPHPGKIEPHPWIRTSSKSLQLQQSRNEHEDPPGQNAPDGLEPRPPWVIACWLTLMQSSRGDSCLLANVAVPPHPAMRSSHFRNQTRSIPLPLRQPGDRNGDPRGRTPRSTVWKSHRNWPFANWLAIVHRASTPRRG